MQDPYANSGDRSGSRFDDANYLRRLLLQMQDTPLGDWRSDPELNALSAHIMDRYGALARKHGFEPSQAASAAWEVLTQPGTCTATDPWGQITTAILITFRSRRHANATLCSEETARRGELGDVWVQRFSDQEDPITDYHPAFVINRRDRR